MLGSRTSSASRANQKTPPASVMAWTFPSDTHHSTLDDERYDQHLADSRSIVLGLNSVQSRIASQNFRIRTMVHPPHADPCPVIPLFPDTVPAHPPAPSACAYQDRMNPAKSPELYRKVCGGTLQGFCTFPQCAKARKVLPISVIAGGRADKTSVRSCLWRAYTTAVEL
ncbi:hypothetical protein CERZMDRAFT_89794 [Cercospora zeae-maydis SCOH1-5]|uniref:Uncharacterized protein n=1 Tax=Cercospora zeae-maydis SCOH1-5 TaxID=717836 RepID=A0A6A6FVI0_9PEZI|nr:hypothetical protein CERZMDRAFT_89794 [Cercospora zeae-maydis SCOH1-5]